VKRITVGIEPLSGSYDAARILMVSRCFSGGTIMESRILSKGVAVIVCACTAVAFAGPAKVMYVDAGAAGAKTGSSWADAYNSLQDALAAAAAADKPVEIRVGQGVYKPDQGADITPGDRAATFKLLNGVAIRGGYAGGSRSDPNARDIAIYETILNGDLAGDDGSEGPRGIDNSLRIVTGSGTDQTAILDGCTITAGLSSFDPAGTSGDRGAGLMVNAGSPTVLNCRFTGNHASGPGGVVTARNGASPILTGCEFLNNEGTGLYCMENSNPVLTDCRFEGNIFRGLESLHSSPVVIGCQFVGNRRNAIRAIDSNSILTDCVFTGSGGKMPEQGIDFVSGRATLTGCAFTGFKDGAMEAPDDLTLVRCTFKDNSGFLAGAVRSYPNRRLTALECVFAGNDGSIAGAISGGDMELHDCEFTGNSASGAGAVDGGRERFVATGCVFSGNSSQHGAGAISSRAEVQRLSNCTFVGNRGQYGTFDFLPFGPVPIRLTQCIVRDGPEPLVSRFSEATRISVTYSNVQGGYPGEGNFDVDPCFVDPGGWDPNGTPDDPNDDFWVAGDYHLKSQAGHWDRATETWIRDDVTSACIDAGDPNAPLGTEPFPNGGYVNIGAYAGSAEASKTYFGEPVCENQIAGDINGDCIVDLTDVDILLSHWLMEGAGLVNLPPTITLLSPKDGDELTYPAPILFQAAASDPDGTVLRVKYTMEYRTANSRHTISSTVADPADNWDTTWTWSNIDDDGTYTVWAEAMDDEGAKTATPKIKVTFHPAK